MRSIRFALLLGLLAACHHHHGTDGQVGTPVFSERERNDNPLTANHFGLLEPGDRFFIDGFVRNDSLDPFDGFAFTAHQPLHVDFQLFIGDAFADLDVLLYDPQIDQFVASFATDLNPEQGGVDVFGSGLDFHLVVDSFIGESSYSLEIVVLPLLPLTAAEGSPAARLAGQDIAAVGARAEHAVEAEDAYRKAPPSRRPVLEIEQVITIDEHTGQAVELVLVRKD